MTGIDRLMWQRAFELIEQAERLRRYAFQPNRSLANAAVWEPPIDVFETASALVIVVAMPGVGAAGIDISVRGRELVISGESSRPGVCSEAVVRRLEIPYGRFERHIELPPGIYQIESREHNQGCLLLKLSKVS